MLLPFRFSRMFRGDFSGLFRLRPHPRCMTTTPAIDDRARPVQALPETIRSLLRIEGLAIAAATAVLYARTGASWWLFAALWLAPDLSMLGYLARPCRAARVPHLHAAITLALAALVVQADSLIPYALIWANHIAVDRLLGYGLKFSTGFGWTHLGIKGKAHREAMQRI